MLILIIVPQALILVSGNSYWPFGRSHFQFYVFYTTYNLYHFSIRNSALLTVLSKIIARHF